MNAKVIIPQQVSPYGDWTFVTEMASFSSMNPRLRVATLYKENLMPCKFHRLTVADEGYHLLVGRKIFIDNLSNEMVSHNHQQKHSKQEYWIK